MEYKIIRFFYTIIILYIIIIFTGKAFNITKYFLSYFFYLILAFVIYISRFWQFNIILALYIFLRLRYVFLIFFNIFY